MKELIIILLILSVGNAALFAKTYMLGTTIDIDPAMAGKVFEVGMGIYDRAEEGSSIKLMTATGKPSLKFDRVKEDFPNRMLARNARQQFEKSLVETLGLALRANKGREVSGFVDAPRLIRELRNHVGEGEATIVIAGNVLWTGDPEFSFVDRSQSELDSRLRRPSHGSVSASKFLSPFSMEGVPDMPNCRVVWFDPTGDAESGDDAYKSEVANFWNCMFDAVSIPMAPIQSNSSTAIDMAFREDCEILDLVLNGFEEGARMLTLEEMRPTQIFHVDAIPFTHVWVGDLSPSQSKAREAMARRLSDSRGASGEYHGLFVFESGGGALYSENSDVLEIAAAFRQVKPNGGADSPGSFSATLKKVRDELRNRGARKCSVRLLSDVGPSEKGGVPESEGYASILRDILSDGHEVTFIRTNRKLDVRKFIPKEIKIKVVDL